MPDSSEALHVAIRAALVADATVTGLVGTRIYDHVPQSATFPFVQISMVTGAPWDGVALDGWEAVMRVDVWDRLNGQSGRAYAVARAIEAVLHNEALTVAGFQFVNGRMLDQRLVRDDDNVTVNVFQRYRYATHEV